MKRFSKAGEPPVVIPIVVVAVDVHLALVIPAVERGVALYEKPSDPPPVEYSPD